jgi:hypothetical protein
MDDFNVSPEFEAEIRRAVNPPGPRPEFVARLRRELAGGSSRPRPHLVLRPAWVIAVLLVAALLAFKAPEVAAALKRLFGYVPGIGLVEPAAGMRVLAEPVSTTRDGIALTLEQVIGYQDHVELSYRVAAIPSALRFDAEKDAGREDEFCYGEDSYPTLRLPDGSTLQPDPMALGGAWLADGSGYTAGHSFSAPIPVEMSGATFFLRCVSEVKRGAGPEDWMVPFNLVAAREGTVIGEEVMSVAPSEPPRATDKGITLTPDGFVREADGVVIYMTMGWDESNRSRLATVPMSLVVTDSTGKSFLVSPIDHPGRAWNDEERQFVYKTHGIPADGPLTLTIDRVWAFYTLDKTREMMEQPSFRFDAPAAGQVGQTWTLDEHFQFGDVQFDIPLARTVEQDGHRGYEFLVRTAEPYEMVMLHIGDYATSNFWSEYPSEEGAMLLYDGDVPQSVDVLVYKIGVVVEGLWQVTWTPSTE